MSILKKKTVVITKIIDTVYTVGIISFSINLVDKYPLSCVAGHSEAPGPQVWPGVGAAGHPQYLGGVRGPGSPSRPLLPASGHKEVSWTLSVLIRQKEIGKR